MVTKLLLGFFAVSIFSAFFTGCAWTGTKKVDIWGLKWENYAGMDAQVGFNNIDRVRDNRGVGK